MCGIAGYFAARGEASVSADALAAATAALAHRGPDDQGLWFSEKRDVGFGHRRLSILDLSSVGHQPMHSACGRWVMVYNGEIYNFREVRSQLQSLGHHFSGTGDSEVILAAFAQWGPLAADRFIGMFAIALWHLPTGELHLLRDRLGVKPLYYRWDGKTLLFGSELKALRAFGGWAPEIDRDALNDYLRYGYIDDPRTIYRDTFKLPPAHRLKLKADGEVELHRWWNVLERRVALEGRSEAQLTDELEDLMVDAFKYRMISDVPVGVFLSGGVDSSLVAALLQKHGDQRIKTFTIGFDDPAFDESINAAAVAAHLGTEHHSQIVRAADAAALLPRWGDLYDEPFADESGIPTYLVSKSAARHVKVVLSADGGDELFSGYNSHTTVIERAAQLRAIPAVLRHAVAMAVRGLRVRNLDELIAGVDGAAAQWLHNSVLARMVTGGERLDMNSVGELHDELHRSFSDNDIHALTGWASPARELADVYPGSDGEKLCLWDLNHYMSADVLAKVDRATMALSIEGREPLLDHRLVEFAFSLPYGMRRGPLGPKHLLRKVLHRHVPRELVDRPKQGFALPIADWLGKDLAGLVNQLLDDDAMRSQGLFDPAAVRAILKRFRAGDTRLGRRVWRLVAFQLWYRQWMPAV